MQWDIDLCAHLYIQIHMHTSFLILHFIKTIANHSDSRMSRFLNRGAGEGSWESLDLKGDQISQSWRKSVLNIHWKDWYWGWISNTLTTWWEEPTHCKRTLMLGKIEGKRRRGSRGWDGSIASPTQWTWIQADSGRKGRTGEPGVLQSIGSQKSDMTWLRD